MLTPAIGCPYASIVCIKQHSHAVILDHHPVRCCAPALCPCLPQRAVQKVEYCKADR